MSPSRRLDSRRGGSGDSTTHRPNQRSRLHHDILRGFFKNGVWYCDCNPALPAQRFQVKKASANHGRWFYSCQKTGDRGCGFFLWEDDASHRMKAAVLHSNDLTRPPISEVEEPVIKKRKLPWGNEKRVPTKSVAHEQEEPRGRRGVEESYDWPQESDEEISRLLSQVAEQAERNTTSNEAVAIVGLQAPTTPKKLQGDMIGTTYSAHGLPTPSTTKSIRHSPDRTKDILKSSVDAPTTPTPVRFRNAETETLLSAPTQPAGETDLLSSIMGILLASNPPVELPARTRDKLNETIRRHEAKARGYQKGRDKVRGAILERDAEIAELKTIMHDLEGQIEGLRCIREMGDP